MRVRRTREGAFVLLRRGRVVWRSSRLYPNDGGDVAFGPGSFSFGSYRQGAIYLTDLRSPERVIARGRGLYVLGFTRTGHLLVVGQGTVSVVSASGRTLRRFAYSPRRGLGFDGETATLYFVTPEGVLAQAHDMRVLLLARAPAEGGPSVIDQGFLAWSGKRSIVVTDRSGDVIAAAHWPRAFGSADLGLIPSSDGRLFAYRLWTGELTAGTDMRLSLLRAGERRGRVVLRHRIETIGCGSVPGGMSWHGHHLLYAFGDLGRVEVLDADSGARTSLTRLVRSVPRRAPVESVQAAWASDFAP